MRYSHLSEARLKALGRVIGPKLLGKERAWTALRKKTWDFDPEKVEKGKVKVRKRRPGRPRKRKPLLKFNKGFEPVCRLSYKRKEKAARRRPRVCIKCHYWPCECERPPKRPAKVRLIDFAIGDWVMFNPERKGHPTCVDGIITRVRRCYDRHAQEFIERLSITQSGKPLVWTVRYPGIAIRKVKKK